MSPLRGGDGSPRAGLFSSPNGGRAPSGSRTPNYFNKVAPAPKAYACATCGGRFTVADVLDQQGAIICKDCYAAAAAQQADEAEFSSSQSISPPSGEHVVSEEVHADRHDTVSFEPLVPSADAPRDSAPGKRPVDFLPLLIGGAVGAIILGAVIVYVSTNDSKREATSPPVASTAAPNPAQTLAADPTEWERKYAPHLERLRAQAKSLEASGDQAAALSRYQEMLNFAASPGAKIRSEAVLAELADARSRWEYLVKIVKPVDQTPPPATPGESVASAAPTGTKPRDSEKPSVPTQENEPPDKHSTPGKPPEASSAVAENPSPRQHPTSEPAPIVVEDEANWPANHIPEIQALLGKAQETGKGPDKVAALSLYERVVRLVQGHEKQITDPELKKNLAAANDQRKQLLAAVRDSDEAKQATSRTLLAAGLKSLHDSKWKTAEESLTDARHVTEKMSKPVDYFKDNNYVQTLHALAVAYLENKNVQRAGEMFDDGAAGAHRLHQADAGDDLEPGCHRCGAEVQHHADR